MIGGSLGLALRDVLGGPSQMQQPMPQQAPMTPYKPSRGQMIAGILGDALAGAAGRPGQFAQHMGQMRQQEREQAQEAVQWQRDRMAGREDKQWEWQNKPREAPQPYRFEDNAGNVWERGADGRNVRIFTDTAPKQIIQDGMMINVPNPYAPQQPSRLTAPPVTEDLWNQGTTIGGSTPRASSTFPRR